MTESLIEHIANLAFGVTLERAEDCAEMEHLIGAEICGKYNRWLPPNTLRIETDAEHYLVLLREGELWRLDLFLPGELPIVLPPVGGFDR